MDQIISREQEVLYLCLFFHQYSAKKNEVTLTDKEADKRQSHITASHILVCNHLCCKTRYYTCSLKLPVAAHCSTCKVSQAVICGDLRACECVSVSLWECRPPSPAVSVSPCVPEFPVRLCLYVCMSLGWYTLV